MAKEIKEIDKTAVEQYGLPGVVLMENAGAAVAREMEEILGTLSNKKVCIFCGKGNNGGDGFVIARYLFNTGAKVKVFLLYPKVSIQGDALVHYTILEKMNVDVMEVAGERGLDKVKLATTFSDCLVDAMLGTGFNGELTGSIAQIAEMINKSGRPVFAVDIPTGVDADTGQIADGAVKADYTVTLALVKQGLLLYPGAANAGEILIDDIGIPKSLLESDDIKQNRLSAGRVKAMLLQRRPDAYKGNNGRVAVLAGSRGLTGAAALTSQAALKAGAGLVALGIGESLHGIMEVKLTEVMTRPLPEVLPGVIGQEALQEIEEMMFAADVIALGPGLGRHEETQAVVRHIIGIAERPLVIDADGLNALVGHTGLLAKAKALPVLTPHAGEMARMVGLSVSEVNEDRVYFARQTAMEWQSIVVFKGAPTIVAFPDGEIYFNATGNEGMATGGTGDVLTGVIAGLIAQGMSSHSAALAGVYIHGLAGDIAAQTGVIGMTANDVLQALPAARLGLTNRMD
jgi:NAD(P)H-hydrate epimerase